MVIMLKQYEDVKLFENNMFIGSIFNIEKEEKIIEFRENPLFYEVLYKIDGKVSASFYCDTIQVRNKDNEIIETMTLKKETL